MENTSMTVPWWHYLGAMVVGWAIAAVMYTDYFGQKIASSFKEVH